MKNLIILGAFLFNSCAPILNWQNDCPDNEAEESIEDFIKNKTGIDIDLTPLTGPEKEPI